MTDISKNTLDKIKKENVHPIPRHYFLFKRSVLWILFGLSIFFGSIASGIAIFLLTRVEWDVSHYLARSFIGFLLLVFPYFWLIFLLGFSIFSYIFFRHTEQGYRYKTAWIVLLSILLSIVGGALLHATKLPESLERVCEENVPFYHGLGKHRHKMWMSPHQGLLAGEITHIRSGAIIELEDLNGMKWTVHTGDAIWRGNLSPSENLQIKLIGQMKGDGQFVAYEIRPWEGQRHRGRIQRNRRMGTYR